jgi:hypothetical protein
MSTIQVQTGALQSAAGVISLAADQARNGSSIIARADGAGFGGEPIGAAYEAMQERALKAAAEIANTTEQLAANTGAAVYGYIVTDKGAIPSSRMIGHGGEIPRLP